MENKTYTLYEVGFYKITDDIIRCFTPKKAFEGTEEEIYKFINKEFYIKDDGPLSVVPEDESWGIERYEGGMISCYPNYKDLTDGQVLDKCEKNKYSNLNKFLLNKLLPSDYKLLEDEEYFYLLPDEGYDTRWGTDENASPLKYFAFRPVPGAYLIDKYGLNNLYTDLKGLNNFENQNDKFFFIMKEDVNVTPSYFTGIVLNIASY